MTDRPNVPPLIVSDDAIRPFHVLLEQLKKPSTLELFIYTRGGSMMSAITLVKMFRKYSKKFNVIVPFRAHSAGTQIAIGADSITMGRIGQLSPVDPSTTNMFNPLLNPLGNPSDPRNRKAISVEDVQAYFNLAKERLGLVSEKDRLEVFKELTRLYEPLALGNVNRVYTETRTITREMLLLHMDAIKDEERINRIIKALTEEYTHDYIISRDTAKEIGLNVIEPKDDEEELIMNLYESYEAEFKMNIPFDAEALLPTTQPPVQTTLPTTPQQVQPRPQQPIQQPTPTKFQVKLGAIESFDDSFIWVSEGLVYPALSNIIIQVITQPGMYPPSPSIKIKSGAWYKHSQLSGTFE